ncbi:MAG: hypothetical protein DCC55_33525 [Chloroflexi bacterium]|nr:MAG: hypothetical protein DCC55_33525 [Chloroflexota bacterium]
MKTYFYERTAYKLSNEPVPNCFIKLDDHFDRSPAVNERPGHLAVILAESICLRMADVEMYAFLIEDARKRHGLEKGSDVKAAILTRSFLFGYLGAACSLLECSAMTLALVYDLPLAPAERTFRNGDFWHQLVTQQPNVHRRYHAMRLFFNEVLRWSDETVTRIPPLVVSHNQFGPFSSREMHLRVLDEEDIDLPQLTGEPQHLTWLDPLLLHDRWKPRLLSLCEKLCHDIEAFS